MVRPLVVPNPKVTLVIDDGIQGWTETHFYGSAVPLTDGALYTNAKALAIGRCNCLDGINAKLVDVRMSLDNVSHDSTHLDKADIPVPSPTQGYKALGGPDPSQTGIWSYQTMQVSWPIIMSTAQSTTNPILYIAGMPANDSQFGPSPADAGGGSQPIVYLRAYVAVLTTGSLWGALARVWTATPYNVASIVFVAGAGPNPPQLEFTLSAAQALTVFPVGSYVRLNGCTYLTPQKRVRLNGTYTVQSFTGTVLTVSVPRLLVAPTFQTPGFLNASTAGVLTYRAGTYRNITHRKRGRPLYAARGRR